MVVFDSSFPSKTWDSDVRVRIPPPAEGKEKVKRIKTGGREKETQRPAVLNLNARVRYGIKKGITSLLQAGADRESRLDYL